MRVRWGRLLKWNESDVQTMIYTVGLYPTACSMLQTSGQLLTSAGFMLFESCVMTGLAVLSLTTSGCSFYNVRWFVTGSQVINKPASLAGALTGQVWRSNTGTLIDNPQNMQIAITTSSATQMDLSLPSIFKPTGALLSKSFVSSAASGVLPVSTDAHGLLDVLLTNAGARDWQLPATAASGQGCRVTAGALAAGLTRIAITVVGGANVGLAGPTVLVDAPVSAREFRFLNSLWWPVAAA